MSFAKLSAGLTTGMASLAQLATVPPPSSASAMAHPRPPLPVGHKPVHPTTAGARPSMDSSHSTANKLNATVKQLSQLDLVGGAVAGGALTASVRGESLSAAVEAGSVKLSWFRTTAGQISPLNGISNASYTPCLDDVGSRIMVRGRDTHDVDNSGFAESAPIEADSATAAKAAKFLERNEGYFVADVVRLSSSLASACPSVLAGATVELHLDRNELVISSEQDGQSPAVTDTGAADGTPSENGAVGASSLLAGGMATAYGSCLVRLPAASFSMLRLRVDHVQGSTKVTISYPTHTIEPIAASTDSKDAASGAEDAAASQEGEAATSASASDYSSPCATAASSASRHVLVLSCQSVVARDVLAFTVRSLCGLDPYGRDELLDKNEEDAPVTAADSQQSPQPVAIPAQEHAHSAAQASSPPAAAGSSLHEPGTDVSGSLSARSSRGSFSATSAASLSSTQHEPPARRRPSVASVGSHKGLEFDASAASSHAASGDASVVVPSLNLSSFLSGQADVNGSIATSANNNANSLSQRSARSSRQERVAAARGPDEAPSEHHHDAQLSNSGSGGDSTTPPIGSESTLHSAPVASATSNAAEQTANTTSTPLSRPQTPPTATTSAPLTISAPPVPAAAAAAAPFSATSAPSAPGTPSHSASQQSSSAEIRELWAQVTSLTSQVTSLTSALAARDTQVKTLSSQLSSSRAQCEGLTRSLADREAALTSAQAAAAKAASDLARVQAAGDLTAASVASKTEEIKRQASQIAALTSEGLTSRQRLSALTSELDGVKKESSNAKTEVKDLTSQVAKLTSELKTVKESLAAVTKERDAARASIVDLTSQLEAAKAAAASSQSESGRVASETAELRAKLEAAVAERDKAVTDANAAAIARNEARAAAATAEAALTQLKLALTSAETEAAALRTEREDVKAALTAALARATAAEAEQRHLREAADAATAKASVAASEAAVMSNKLSEVSKSVDGLAREKAEAVSKASELDSEVADLRGRLATSEAKMKKYASSADQVKDLQKVIEKLTEQMDNITAERNAAARKADSLRRDVARMTGSSEELKTLDIDKLAKAKKSLEEKVVKLTADNAALREQLEAARASAALAVRPAAVPSVAQPFPSASAAAGSSGSVGSASSALSPSAGFSGGGVSSRAGGASAASSAGGGGGGHMRTPSFLAPPQSFASPSSASMGGASSHSSSGGGIVRHVSHGPISAAAAAQKAEQLAAVANVLVDQLTDKNEELAQQRQQKEMLAARIRELEAKVALLEGRD